MEVPIDPIIARYINPENEDDVHLEAFEIIKKALHNSSSSSSESFTIQDLILKLEVYLTSADDKERHRATLLLADLFHANPDIKFPSSVIHLYSVFFCRRLSDYPSIVPSLHALLALVSFHADSIDPKYYDYVDILQTIFKDIFVQGLAQSIRQKIFELLLKLFSSPAAVVPT